MRELVRAGGARPHESARAEAAGVGALARVDARVRGEVVLAREGGRALRAGEADGRRVARLLARAPRRGRGGRRVGGAGRGHEVLGVQEVCERDGGVRDRRREEGGGGRAEGEGERVERVEGRGRFEVGDDLLDDVGVGGEGTGCGGLCDETHCEACDGYALRAGRVVW